MIDDQFPVLNGIFPLDMKCHPQHQQQQQQQQQQLPPGPATGLMSGNERMLANAIIQPTTINGEALPEMADGGGTSVIGSRNNRNNNGNNNGNNSSSGGSINGNHKTNSSNQHQQTSSGGGLGPGPPLSGGHAIGSGGRTTLGECTGNTSNNNTSLCTGNGNITDCGNGGLNGNGLGGLHHSHSLPLQSLHHHHHHLQHQCNSPLQQPAHQHHASLILQQHHHLHHNHHHHHHHHHQTLSAVLAAASATNVAAAIAASSSSSSSSSSSAGGGGAGCGGVINGVAQCGYCCQPICDRFIMRVVDISYHEGCLKCTTCSIHLVHSCFARDGKLYCRIDYERLFIRNRCLGCGHKIGSDELVMRTLENVFHLKCFACVVCGVLLKKGEQYVVKQGQLFCRFDYEKEVEMLQGFEDFYGDDLFPPKLDGRRGPKRPRTILNTQQRRAFKASFEVSPKPCRKVRENLAKETGLSLRIVQVWFQNQRAKVKKIQKKAKQEQKQGASETDSQESDSSLAKVKDENHSDSESLLESPFSCSGNGAGNVVDGKLRLIKDELQNENLPFNCIETNKENCNKTNEPILNTILGLSYATFQQLMGPFSQTPMINPIDRLYSMQNSYFRPDELNFSDCGKDAGDN